jgi:hypothetical protein
VAAGTASDSPKEKDTPVEKDPPPAATEPAKGEEQKTREEGPDSEAGKTAVSEPRSALEDDSGAAPSGARSKGKSGVPEEA